MDSNQFNWQAYMNLLQNYQQYLSNENSQHPHPLFPTLPLPPPSISENYQISPYFIPNLSLPSLPPPLAYNQSPFLENFQSFQTFHSMPQNTFTTFYKPLNRSSREQTPSNEEVDTQFPQFSTQIG